LKAGISTIDFWQMTPKEVIAAIDAENWRLKIRHEELAWVAWHTAALSRAKTMPRLKDLTDPPRTKALTPDEAKKHAEDFEQMKKGLPERLRNRVNGE
jgi:hypothetical protein